MGKMKLARILLPIPLWLLGSCDTWLRGIIREELAGTETRVATANQTLRKVTSRLDQLEGHLAYCSDEVKSLLSKVQKECQAREVCTPNDANIQVDVLRIDPSKQGRFLSLFQERKHLAFYFPDQLRQLTDVEKKSLRDLIKPTWLDDAERHTRFLVVSNIEDGSNGALKRAESRSWRVIDTIAAISGEMQAPGAAPAEPAPSPALELPKSAAASRVPVLLATNGTPILPKGRTSSPAAPAAAAAAAEPQLSPAKDIVKKGRVLNWIFPFSSPGEILRLEDRPKGLDKLTRSVWVYRVDC